MRSIMLVSPFNRWVNRGTEGLTNVPRVTRLVTAEPGFESRGWEALCLFSAS